MLFVMYIRLSSVKNGGLKHSSNSDQRPLFQAESDRSVVQMLLLCRSLLQKKLTMWSAFAAASPIQINSVILNPLIYMQCAFFNRQFHCTNSVMVNGKLHTEMSKLFYRLSEYCKFLLVNFVPCTHLFKKVLYML